VASAQDTLARIAATAPGGRLRLRVQRGAEVAEVEVPVVERPQAATRAR
jgi:S1-C subfamily serine protease